MSDINYNWKSNRYGSKNQESATDSYTRWISIAVILAIICHIIVLLMMKKIPIFFNTFEPQKIITQTVVVRNISEFQYTELTNNEDVEELSDPVKISQELLSELEMLEEAPENIDLNFSPEIIEAEILVPIKNPVIIGSVDVSASDLTAGVNFGKSIADLGTTDDFFKPAVGQITIDPGTQTANDFDPDKFNTELVKGGGGKVKDGVMKGFTPLAEMTRLSQSDLEKAKGMIGSDLLFDFNKATLRERAKNSLLKVVLIIDKNPDMMCWIEGHTDLIGSKEANMKLSLKRALSVKNWLVHSMKISEDRLFVRGLGMSQPIVFSGDQYVQAINRRVEVKMRLGNSPKYVKPLNVKENLAMKTESSLPAKKARIIKPLINPNLINRKKNLTNVEAIKKPLNVPPKAISVEEKSVSPMVNRKPVKAILVEDPIQPKIPKAIRVE